MLSSNLSVFILNMSVWSRRHACSRSACGLLVGKVYRYKCMLLNYSFFYSQTYRTCPDLAVSCLALTLVWKVFLIHNMLLIS